MKLGIKSIKTEKSIFFFFPFYHTGGAEKVHLEIVRSIETKTPVVFFTLPSADTHFLDDFNNVSEIFEIYPYIKKSGKYKKKITKLIFEKINSHKDAIVFSCHSLYFYEHIHLFNEYIRCIDLLHAFVHFGEEGAEYWSINSIYRLNKRIVINQKTFEDLKEFYLKFNIKQEFFCNVQLIKNWVKVPTAYHSKKEGEQFNFLFVSRNSPEKRVALVGELGARIKECNLGEMTMIGADLELGVRVEHRKYIRFLGAIQDVNKLYSEYEKAHIFILLSTREGMPLTIMEAMANGCLILSSNVGGISFDVKSNINGFLIEATLEDNEILEECIFRIKQIILEKLFCEISKINFEYASNNFSQDNFVMEYRKIFRI
ncbi:MAG: glycosyltransferase family 4 protein [Flavobacteriia bacterium]|nr:glycosyltransferase family 4 protein [Flavobacteriia bacterium]